SVHIKGEWSFARPLAMPRRVGTPEAPVVESQGIAPTDWQPGDIPMAHPNGTGPDWPIAPMQRDAAGVWSVTIPLPSGVFTYAFLIDSAAPDGSDVVPIADPANPPWNEQGG